MEIKTIRTEGLGDSTHILIHDGSALIVDPQRDIDRFEEILNAYEADVRFVFETHLHNDYLSGGRDLAKAAGAELVFPAGAAPVFRHRPAFHGEDLDGGPFVVKPIHTPGHTPEHTSYLVILDGSPVAVFSGGSLLVGSAGRSDLLGLDRADSLSRLQFGSVHRLAELPDDVGLFPTHGAGSFCTASGAGALNSTIGDERRSNPVFAYQDEEAFVKGELSGLVPYPSYYQHMGPTNVEGVVGLRRFSARQLDQDSYEDLAVDPVVVDTRPMETFAAGHLPGSVAIGLRHDFGVWAGWVLPYNSPVVLVMGKEQDQEEAVRQLSRIGFDNVVGVVTNIEEWDVTLDSYETTDVAGVRTAISAGAQILDARAPNEWSEGVIEVATRSYTPDVVDRTPNELTDEAPVWVACETGYRATIAASVLQSRGYSPVVLVGAGVTDVIATESNT